MKFLDVFRGRKDAAAIRRDVSLVVAPGFKDDAEVRVPKARLCESLRGELNVQPGSLLRVIHNGRAVSCRVAAGAKGDEGTRNIRLNPRARHLLGAELETEVRAVINTTPLSSATVPLEVGAAFKGDDADAEPVVRLSSDMRRNLGVTPGDYVNLQSGECRVPARVEVGAQGDGTTARLNPLARGMLQVQVGDLVDIIPFETLILLIDVSGSMDEGLGLMKSKLSATREAILRLISSKRRARERDLLGLVTFGEECELVAEPTDDFDQLKRRVHGICTHGRTAMHEGLQYTLDLLAEAHGLRRIILLSDGCPTSTGTTPIADLACKAREQGVVIDTIGVGGQTEGRKVSYDEGLLRRIAEITGGKFTPVDAVRALEDEFEKLSDAKKIPLLGAGEAA